MSLNDVNFPYAYVPYFDKGKPIYNGYIYIGEPDLDPEVIANQKTIYFVQEDGTQVVGVQPVRTGAGGVPTYNGSPIKIKVDGDYSIKILNAQSAQAYYSESGNSGNFLQTVATLAELQALGEGLIVGAKREYQSLDYVLKNDIDYSTLIAADNAGRYIETTYSATAAWVAQAIQMTPDQFGADGVDDTDAVTKCIASGICLINRETFITGITVDKSINATPNGFFTFIGADGDIAVDVTTTSAWHGPIRVNCNGSEGYYPSKGIRVSGSSNKLQRLYARNMYAPAVTGDIPSTVQGIQISGSNNILEEGLENINLINDGNTNPSMPQGYVDTGDGNNIGDVYQRNCRAGLVINSPTGITKAGNIVQKNMLDNGLYLVDGGFGIDCASHSYEGSEEMVVLEANYTCGKVTAIGDVGAILGLDDAGDVRIGEISILQDADGNSPASIMKTRTGNVASGRVSIGHIHGFLPKARALWNMDVGTVEFLSIGRVDCVVNYKSSRFNLLSNFAGLESCKGFDIGDMNVTVIDEDDTLIGSDNFLMEGPTTNLQHPSRLGSVKVNIVDSDGYTPSSAGFRATNMANNLITLGQMPLQATAGPRIRESGYLRDTPYGVDATPTAGTWKKGSTYTLADATSGLSQTKCITSGTFGTYAEGRTVTADGSTVVTFSASNSELYPGLFVTINGTSTWIVAASTTEMTLADSITAGSGLAIAYTTPVFAGLNYIPAVASATTTDATATSMTFNLTGLAYYPLTNNDYLHVTATVVGVRVAGDMASYVLNATVYRAGAAAQTAVKNVTATYSYEDSAAWNATIVADTTNGGFYVQVTGEAAKTITWRAEVIVNLIET